MRTARLVPHLAAVLLASCVPEPTPPGASPPSPPSPLAPPTPEVNLVELSVAPEKARIDVGEALTLTATGLGEDGAQYDATRLAAWSSSDPTILVVQAPGRVRGLAAGSARIRVALAELEAEATVTVGARDDPPPPTPPAPVSLRIVPRAPEVEVGEELVLEATLTWDDGRAEPVAGEAEWSVSEAAIATLTGATLTGVSPGRATVTARFAGLVDEVEVEVEAAPCTYPAGPSSPIRVGSTMPPLRWSSALGPDGQPAALSLEDVHCGRAPSAPSVIVFVIGAGWCTACPSYIRAVHDRAADIEAAGGLLVFVEAQDSGYRLASSSYADRYITDLVGRGHGVRIGDADTEPTAGALYDAELLRAFPSAFVVRTRDMKILVDQASANGLLPFARIAADPEADWSDPSAPPPATNCGPNDEEPYEPNDLPSQAQVIPPGAFTGGICDGAPDYYRVDLAGAWRLDLSFRHQTGDLDVYVWDEARDRALERGGQKVGSESYTDDESFTYAGPALIRVHGYQGASAPYTLTLTAQ